MEGLSPSQRPFEELMRGWSGFTQTGEEADEGSNELFGKESEIFKEIALWLNSS